MITLDVNGLVVQKNGDGGDCAARSGELVVGIALRKAMGIPLDDWEQYDKRVWDSARTMLIECLHENGLVVSRYTKPPYDTPTSHEWGSSRDQTMPMVIAAAYMKRRDLVEGIWLYIKKNTMFYPNGTDPCGPVDIAIFKRCLALAGSPIGFMDRILVGLGDAQLYGSVLARCSQAQKDPDDVGDDIGLTLYLNLCMDSLPSSLSKAAIDVYRRRRPNFKFLGGDNRDQKNYIPLPGSGVQYAFDHYHRPETGGNALNELFRPIISERFS